MIFEAWVEQLAREMIAEAGFSIAPLRLEDDVEQRYQSALSAVWVFEDPDSVAKLTSYSPTSAAFVAGRLTAVMLLRDHFEELYTLIRNMPRSELIVEDD